MKIQIKLGFRNLSNQKAVIQGNLYADGVAENPYFNYPNIKAKGQAIVLASDNLRTALSMPRSTTRTQDIKVARIKWESEVTELTRLQEIVVNNADVSDEKKIEMVKSGNREVVEHPIRQKYNFTVKRGKNSGEVVFTAETKNAVAHLYTWTDDHINYTNKADPETSTSAKKTAKGLPVGKELAFFHKGIFRKKSMDWEGPIFLTVL
jgi:hypothetical protein